MNIRLPSYYVGFLVFFIAQFSCKLQAAEPYPRSSVISGINFIWSTHDRRAPGSDNWPLTWADDNNQYTSWGDGGGFGGTNSIGRVSLGVARIEGVSDSYTGVNIYGGANSQNQSSINGKSYGIISINGILYMWVSPGSDTDGYRESRLYKSVDHGANWTAANWVFTQSDGFINPTFVQYGKDYAGSRDNYVYIYANNLKDASSLKVQTPGEVTLMRVPKSSLMDRSQYEFFSGLDINDKPTWTATLTDRVPVFNDPNGVGWNLSAIYNKWLGRYFIITEHTQSFASNIGIFDAPEPWGPWTVVYYGKFGGQSGVPMSNFFYNFSPKWWGNNGTSFVLVFTGTGVNDSWNSVSGYFTLTAQSAPSIPTGLMLNIR